MGTASGTFPSWSCFALLNHLLLTQAVLSVGCTGKGQDLLLTECPPALSGGVLWAALVSPSVFLWWLLPFIVIPKTLHWSRREGAVTKWDWKEKWADGTFKIPFSLWWSYEQHQWSLPLERELVPSFQEDSTAQQYHLPQARTCLLVRTRFAWHSQHPWSLSNPLVWEMHCSPIPMLPQQSEFVFPSWSGEHPTARAQRNNFYIRFPLKHHHLPDGVGSVKVLKLRCGGFLHKSGGVNHGGMAQLQLRSHRSALPLLWQPGQRTPHCLNSCLVSSGRWLPFSPGRRAHRLDSLHNN